MGAETIIALSSIVTPVTVMITAIVVGRAQARTEKNVNLGNVATNEIHDAVRTSNGQTLADLAEQNEGRRIVTHIPAEEQTASERQYVENLTAQIHDPIERTT